MSRGSPRLALLRSERGVSLVMTMVVLMLVSSIGAGAAYFGSRTSRAADSSLATSNVEDVAEAGLDLARSVLWSAPDPTQAGSVPAQSSTVDGHPVTFSGAYDAATGVWTLTSVGSVANPSATGQIRRAAETKVQVGRAGTGTLPTPPAWYYVFSNDSTGCLDINGSVEFHAPLYLRNSLCLGGSARFYGPALHVEGTLSTGGSARVGESSAPIALANVVGGCSSSFGSPGHTCTGADRVYATSITQTPGTLTKPALDLAGWYVDAAPGPTRGCTVGSFPGGFDTDTILNRSRPTFDLAPGYSYSCKAYLGNAFLGEISYDHVARMLTVAGTILLDGDVTLGSSTTVYYQGHGTIYATGTWSFNGSARLCAVAACDASWDAADDELVIVSGATTSPGISVGSGNVLQVASFSATGYDASGGAVNYGPVIAESLSYGGNVTSIVTSPVIPSGAPGAEPRRWGLFNIPSTQRIYTP